MVLGRLVVTHSTYIKGLIPWLRKLAERDEIQTVTPGVISNGKGKSEDLLIRLTRKTLGGYKLVARKGKETQDIFVITSLEKSSMIKAIKEAREK